MINKDFISKIRENNISHTDTDESMPAGSGGGTDIFNTGGVKAVPCIGRTAFNELRRPEDTETGDVYRHTRMI